MSVLLGEVVLGDDVEGVVLWSGVVVLGVVVLGLDVVLPEVCASIIMLNVNASAMINKTFFMMFFSQFFIKSMGPSEKLLEKLCSERLRPHLHQQSFTMPAICQRVAAI